MLLLNFKVVLNVFILLKSVPFAYYFYWKVFKTKRKNLFDMIKSRGKKNLAYKKGFFFFLLGNDNEKKSPWSIS